MDLSVFQSGQYQFSFLGVVMEEILDWIVNSAMLDCIEVLADHGLHWSEWVTLKVKKIIFFLNHCLKFHIACLIISTLQTVHSYNIHDICLFRW